MVGHVIASASIGTGATTIVNGQLIALTGAVTLGGTSIVDDSCTHTVTFLGNTSDGGTTAAQSANTATALTTNGFTKTGSTFSGWNTLANNTGTAYANTASYSFAADLTLYAQWTLIPPPIHTVTFLGNTSDGGATTSQSANTATALTTNGFTKTGSTFSGWNTLADNTGTAYSSSASYSFAADLTLYAQWTLIPPPIHTVTFLGNTSDGGATASQSANTTTALTTNGFTKTGSTFSGWNTLANNTGTAYANSASYSFAADLTLYAQWTLIPAPVSTPTPVPTLPATPAPPAISPTPQPTVVPTVMATATLRIIKLVVNRFGGTSLPSNFAITIRKTGSSTYFNPVQGLGEPGAVINLVPGTYDLSEAPTAGYRGVWSGVITAGGQVVVIANQTVSVTRTNYDLMQPRASTPAPITESPFPTSSPQATPSPTTNPKHTLNGGAIPVTATPWINLLILGLLLLLVSTLGFLAKPLDLRRSERE